MNHLIKYKRESECSQSNDQNFPHENLKKEEKPLKFRQQKPPPEMI